MVLILLFSSLSPFTSSVPLSFYSHHFTRLLWLFFYALTIFSLQQSLSTSQAQALSCVESLCCYQHGQSGCSRLAHLLEQMTGQCKASASNCHASNRSNRWGGRRRQETMIRNPNEPSPSLGVKNLGCSPDCYSP